MTTFILFLAGYVFVALIVNVVIRCAGIVDSYFHGYETDVLMASIFWPISTLFFILSSLVDGFNGLARLIATAICPNQKK